MNVVSFSLYGTDEKYQTGIIQNARQVKELLPGWKMCVYASNDCPQNTISELLNQGCEVHIQNSNWHSNGMFWRYLPLGHMGIEKLIFRDADSRITQREVQAIDRWVRSGEVAHIVRDHPFHQTPILGGLWGIDNSKVQLVDFWELANEFSNKFGEDQRFLSKYVYPLVHNRALVHDTFFAYEPKMRRSSIPNFSETFMGESFTETELSDFALRKVLESVQKSYWKRFFLKVSSKKQAKLLLYKSYFISKRAFAIPE